jgi:hypothetical protein
MTGIEEAKKKGSHHAQNGLPCQSWTRQRRGAQRCDAEEQWFAPAFAGFMRETQQRLKLSTNAIHKLTNIGRKTLTGICDGDHGAHLHTFERFCWGLCIPIDKAMRTLKRRIEQARRENKRST